MRELRFGTNVYNGGTFVANLAGIADERLAEYASDPESSIAECARGIIAERARIAHAPASERPCHCDGMHGLLHHTGVNCCNFGPGAYRFRRVY